MPRIPKSKSTVPAVVAESEPVSVSVSEPVSVENVTTKVKKPRAPRAPKAEVALAAESTSESTPEVADVVDSDTPLIEQSTEFLAKLQQLGMLISSLKTEYRTLEKKWTRELKVAQKQNSKRKRKSGNRAPSGFVKPTRISDELASFLGKNVGTEMARTSVTREINLYIRTNNLQDKENGRKINPDLKLASLLKIEKTDVLTYFNLQRYMSPHFAKNVKDANAPVLAPVV